MPARSETDDPGSPAGGTSLPGAPVPGAAGPEVPVSDGRASDGPIPDGPIPDGPIPDGPIPDGPVSGDTAAEVTGAEVTGADGPVADRALADGRPAGAGSGGAGRLPSVGPAAGVVGSSAAGPVTSDPARSPTAPTTAATPTAAADTDAATRTEATLTEATPTEAATPAAPVPGAEAPAPSAGGAPAVRATDPGAERTDPHPATSSARLGVSPEADQEPDTSGYRRYLNRELSTLDFNHRVMALAAEETQPLLERLKYLAIFSSNMDEFFQVRVAGLKDQQAAGVLGTASDGLSVTDQLKAIRTEVEWLLEWRRALLFDVVLPRLSERGLTLTDVAALDDEDRRWLAGVFEQRIFPVLTPLAVDPGHPFPYISNLSLNLAVIVRDPVAGHRRFARVKVPPLLPGFLVTPEGKRFVPLEQVIAAHLESLFPGMEIESHHPFRVTRNVDLALEEDEADDLLVAVELELRRRRFGRAVRLEIDRSVTDEVRTLLVRELDLGPDDVYDVSGPLDLTGLLAIHDLDRPELKDEVFLPITPPPLVDPEGEQADIFAAIRDGDILVHHPYDSFSSSVEAFIIQASRDPDVLTIKQTLYRTSGDSPVVQALIRAAERGKQVAALVELKARGDEAANIGWARALERAGVHVVYGLVGLKTHSKTALVVRQEGDGIRRYCHIGTGNYNSTTARLYEDLGVLTASPALGADLTDLFNYLTGYSRRVDYRELIVAPTGLRSRMLELIAAETALGRAGRIVWKCNSLVDREIIDALYEASAAGVEIDLITRSICCLRPGVPGLSETIRVRSLVGRWLEHSRIYYFGAGAVPAEGARTDGGTGPAAVIPAGGRFLLGSADMMERNLDRRVEAVVPVPASLTGRLGEILEVELADDVLAWSLQGDGTWSKVANIRGFNAQTYFQEAATARDRARRDAEAGRVEP